MMGELSVGSHLEIDADRSVMPCCHLESVFLRPLITGNIVHKV